MIYKLFSNHNRNRVFVSGDSYGPQKSTADCALRFIKENLNRKKKL